MRLLEHGPAETLWCLDGPQGAAVDGLGDDVAVDALDRVGHGQSRHHRVCPRAYRGGHRVDQLDRCQRPGSVVDEDDTDRVGQRRQRRAHRLRPGSPARHDVQRRAGVVVGQQRAYGGHLVGRRGHDHEVDQAGCRQVAHGVHEQRHSAEQPERFGGARTEPFATPGRWHDGGHLLGAVSRRCAHVATATGCANTMRPLAVVSTLVTTTVSSLPTDPLARSTTIIVPSSR